MPIISAYFSERKPKVWGLGRFSEAHHLLSCCPRAPTNHQICRTCHKMGQNELKIYSYCLWCNMSFSLLLSLGFWALVMLVMMSFDSYESLQLE